MRECKNCKGILHQFIKDKNGKRIDCRRREYCIECNPVGERKFWKGKATNRELGIARNHKTQRECPICKRQHITINRSPICYTCKNKQIRLDRRTEAYKILGNKCSVCDYNKCMNALDIHHRDGNDKKLTFANSWGLNWQLLEEELKKCVLLCCRCHREVHDGLIDL